MSDTRHSLGQHVGRKRGPAAQTLGHRLVEIDTGRGYARAEFHAGKHFCNPLGMVQGGILAAMLDQILIDAVHVATAPDRRVTTLEMNCRYLLPASHGRLTAEAEVTRLGRSTAFVAGSITDPKGTVLVSADAVAGIGKARD
jgi:uncharacterized protein (TIGR00369 family)